MGSMGIAGCLLAVRFCPHCATELQPITLAEDGGDKERLRCPACGWTHWNNPTPVLAAIVEIDGKVLLARNAAWPGKMFALITGFMEAGESPQEGIAREVKEETNLDVQSATLVGAYEFLRMNQVIIAYHVVATGQVQLSPELVDYRLYDLPDLKCWPAGTGYALADWLRTRGHEPVPGRDAAKGLMTMDIHKEIDTRGLNCPLPILKAKKALSDMASGQLLKVVATDNGSLRDFQAFAKQTGNELVEQQTVGEEFIHILRRR
eukprot:gene11124-11205_t